MDQVQAAQIIAQRSAAAPPSGDTAVVLTGKVAGQVQVNRSGTPEMCWCNDAIDPQPGDTVALLRTSAAAVVLCVITPVPDPSSPSTGPSAPAGPVPVGGQFFVPATSVHSWLRPVDGMPGAHDPTYQFDPTRSFAAQGVTDTQVWTGQIAYTAAAIPDMTGRVVTGVQVRVQRRSGGPATATLGLWGSADGFPTDGSEYGPIPPVTASASNVTQSLSVGQVAWLTLPVSWWTDYLSQGGSLVTSGPDLLRVEGLVGDPQAGLLQVTWASASPGNATVLAARARATALIVPPRATTRTDVSAQVFPHLLTATASVTAPVVSGQDVVAGGGPMSTASAAMIPPAVTGTTALRVYGVTASVDVSEVRVYGVTASIPA